LVRESRGFYISEFSHRPLIGQGKRCFGTHICVVLLAFISEKSRKPSFAWAPPFLMLWGFSQFPHVVFFRSIFTEKRADNSHRMFLASFNALGFLSVPSYHISPLVFNRRMTAGKVHASESITFDAPRFFSVPSCCTFFCDFKCSSALMIAV
jgi:hypothetical protein